MDSIIGRKQEKKRFSNLLSSNEAEFIAVYGRRRVGKTFLIAEFFREKGFYFELTGQYNASMALQLQNFITVYKKVFGIQDKIPKLKSWNQAFEMLKERLEEQTLKEKVILFFDELPWLSNRKSGFLGALEHFWNTWASRQKSCKLIVCGSAASWIIQNIINAKGGLHNRLTATIRLLPFSLSESMEFLRSRGIRLNERQLLDIYMVTGGVPHYLKQIKKDLSAAQNINELCFRKDGFLTDEFNRLFGSLFENSADHKKLVVALAGSKNGLDRTELRKVLGAKPGGTLNRILANLEEAGFIMRIRPFGRVNREVTYRLCDEYCRFYLNWIVKAEQIDDDRSDLDYWQQQSTSQRWKIWAGLAFEDVCFKHIGAIKKALGINGIMTSESSWLLKGNSEQDGAQIDLLIDRNDQCITICEIKYYWNTWKLDKTDAADLQRKISLFKEATGTKKTLFLSLILVEDFVHNENSRGLVNNVVLLKDLMDS